MPVLEHKYVDASDDIAAYQADHCGRQAVTAEWAWDNLVDQTLYVYRESDFDPWLIIDGGMDKLTNQQGEYILCYGRTGELKVDRNFRVFANKVVVQEILRRQSLRS
jgi:hypothetical protein